MAETEHHELWQRATLTAALVGRDIGALREAAAGMERFVESRFPEGVSFERGIVSTTEVFED